MRIRRTDRKADHGHFFLKNMNNQMVQQKLCTEPKDNPQDACRFAVEEGISQHQRIKSGRRDRKNEPVYAVTERKNPAQDVV